MGEALPISPVGLFRPLSYYFQLINGLIGSFLAFYSALGLWLMAQGSWLMTHGSWLMTHGLWLMAHGQYKIWRGVPQASGPRAKFFIGYEP